jgi:uncharacterized protein (TIGR02284 family)
MTTDDKKTALILNDLMLAARDAAEGFKNAADHVKELELMQLLAGYAEERMGFARELEERLRTMRYEPARLPNPAAAAHRVWMDLRAAIESNDTHALLAECERGEDFSVKAYAAALQDRDMDELSRQLIQRQYEQVQAAHDRIKQLRDSATYAHR